MNAKKLYLLYSFLVIFTLALAAVKIIQFADGVNEGIKLVGESTDLDQPSLVKVPAVFCIGNISNVKIKQQPGSVCNDNARLEHDGGGEPIKYFYKDNSEAENLVTVVPNGFDVQVSNILECNNSILIYFISTVLLSWGMVIVYIIIIMFLYKLFVNRGIGHTV